MTDLDLLTHVLNGKKSSFNNSRQNNVHVCMYEKKFNLTLLLAPVCQTGTYYIQTLTPVCWLRLGDYMFIYVMPSIL